jgi:ubiquinone biosynthesis protein Coq4
MSAAEVNKQMHLEYLTGLKGFISFARDPGETDSVFDMAEGFRHTETYQLSMEYLKSQPEIQPIVKERYIAPTPDMEALLKLPEESLGYRYASYMKGSNFDPEFYRKIQVQDDNTYISLRLRQTHDIWHQITGFGTDPAGEVGLQGFYLAQTHTPTSVAIMAGVILNTLLKSADDLTDVMSIIGKGYSMGLKAKPFLAQKWEENWEKPLAEWRAEMNVEPITKSA